MNNENFHPVLTEPPLAHALHTWNEQERLLTYEYNGTNIISMEFPEGIIPGFRHGSDGSVQSIAYIQQIFVTLDQPVWVKIKFCLGSNTISVKGARAQQDHGILSQMGNLLIYNANALYDRDQDLLVEVNGCEWNWDSDTFVIEGDKKVAYMNVLLGKKPLYINLKMQYYRKHLGYNYYEPWKHKTNEKAIAGWCSWEAYRRNIDAEKIRDIVSFMGDNLRDYGLEYIQVDDGYQKMPLPYYPEGTMADGWNACDEKKFPNGHEGIVSDIKSRGFTPAIWTNSNITNPEFAKLHKEDLMYGQDGPLIGEWIDYIYSCLPKTLKEQVTPIFEMFEKHGYKYVKIDAIRHLLFDGIHEAVRQGLMSNDEAEKRFRDYLEATKKGLSDEVYYLASWGEMNEVIGIADGCRIAIDANPTWAGVRMQLFETARWYHAQRVLFTIDADHVCVRTKASWAKSILSLISLTGGVYMLSDSVDAYTDEKIDIIRKTLPTLQTITGEVGALHMDAPAFTWTKLHGFAVQEHEIPVQMEDVSLEDAYAMAGEYPGIDANHPFSTLWSVQLEHLSDIWCVLGRFATIPLRKSNINLEKVGLNPNKKYHVFDFWKEEYLGVVSGELSVEELGLGECQILALREVKDTPQFIASTRHVSMDAVSVEGMNYTEDSLQIQLKTVKDKEERYYFILPENYELTDVVCEQAQCSHTLNNQVLCVEVKALSNKSAITIHYKQVS